jgi:hypothetical protein
MCRSVALTHPSRSSSTSSEYDTGHLGDEKAVIISGVRDTLYDFTKRERRAAVRAYRQLPLRDRRDAFRQAGHGQSHPDPEVAAVVEQWSRVVLRRAWWNKLPGWAQPAASAVMTMTGWWLGDVGIVFLVCGPIAFVVGLIEWSTHRAARQILKAARRSGAPPTTV